MTSEKYTANFATTRDLSAILKWLRENIKGKWEVNLQGSADSKKTNEYQLTFFEKVDRDTFRRKFTFGQITDGQKSTRTHKSFIAQVLSIISRLKPQHR